MITRFLAPALAAVALSACATIPETPTAPEPVTLRIIGLNDFHGNIEPIRRPIRVMDDAGVVQEVPAAGAAYLASAVAKYRAQDKHSMVVAAGDLIGASPLASSIFLDEPAIGAMNRIGLTYNAVGNHEFDRGWQELLRLQQGGCTRYTMRDPCQVESDFSGAEFGFLAANVITADGTTLFPAYGIKRFGTGNAEIAVAIIGLTTVDTPTLVTPSGVDGLTFADEAETINALVPELVEQGVDVIVVSIHQGLYTEVGYNDKSCGGVSGPLLDILGRVDPRVDLVISGHTHYAYVCDYSAIDPARKFLVTSAGYGGSMLTDIALTVDPVLGDVIAARADNIIVQSEVRGADGTLLPANPAFEKFAADAAVAAYVARYVDASQAAADRKVGVISGPAPKPGPATEESHLGNLIADAQLAGTRSAGAQIALMNNSGIRAALDPADGTTVSYGDIYAVQPFGNLLITRSYTGAQLLALFEQQFDGEGFMQTFSVSEGLAMIYDLRRPSGSRVVSVMLDGKPIDPAATYRVTMNSFLAAGGDSFTVFTQGADSVTRPVDLDAIEAYLRAVPVRELPAIGRITEIK
ncbi:bifunctional metallophosphatase/5'-nucleotidase [Allopontixanthobacter sp.]|uniref:bifunctional metallophosphatase/5'-nucleotidase n=1 Tax=Allopontixanthobacter sp. TaxID=2906452 RepID=UPI002AB9EB68|nr:bifunctional metallophosphatase/5'-nucleotidase [Allopontixanthobacter sp.]MDZ4308549.1 bifunctional metallophosphatase/5'-nucleotidase [Allopontixanthobacter sp.]